MAIDRNFTAEVARTAFSELQLGGATIDELKDRVEGARRILIEASLDPRVDQAILGRLRAAFEFGLTLVANGLEGPASSGGH